MSHVWHQPISVSQTRFQCGYCGATVGPNTGYYAPGNQGAQGRILICPNCSRPTYFDELQHQHPGVKFGNDVKGVTDKDVSTLYSEARDATGISAYTSAVMLCRKLLMHIAVEHSAPTGQNFLDYVNFLESNGFVPPNGKAWVDEIRKKGNEANHEIKIMTQADAEQMLHFVEMLLRFIYEFPSMLKPTP